MSIDMKPARDITRSHYGKNLVYFPSRKNHRQVVCESVLEADYCLHLEQDKAVISYRGQPETLAINIGNKTTKYTPDFVIETATATYFVEVKSDRDALSPAYQKKLFTAAALLQDRHSSLRVIDAGEIRPGQRLENLQVLYSRSFHVRPCEYTALVGKAQTLPAVITLAELLEQFSEISHAAKYLAIFEGMFSFDWNQPLSLQTCLERLP